MSEITSSTYRTHGVRWGSGQPWVILALVASAACTPVVGLTPTMETASPSQIAATPAFIPAVDRSTATPQGLEPTPGGSNPTRSPVSVTSPLPLTPTPGPLLALTSPILRPEVAPHTYLGDTCTYLRLRWDPERSKPGTVVAPIFFHAIRPSGDPLYDSSFISEAQFNAIIRHAKELGFETITTMELYAFLTENAPIPPRSMLLMLDDRRPGTLERYFLPVAEENDWTITLGWIIADTSPALWARMERSAATGRLDVQSHGYWHIYIQDSTPEELIRQELEGPLPILEEHFGARPLAIIWPGGNFTAAAVRLARQAGYTLGFSTYSRGPLMFNWIPLGKEESLVGDPLMVLPRFWSTAVYLNLEQAVSIGEQTYLSAMANYGAEADWYHVNCGGYLPPPYPVDRFPEGEIPNDE